MRSRRLSPICKATESLRNRNWPPLPVVLCCFSELTRSGCKKRNAGAMLNASGHQKDQAEGKQHHAQIGARREGHLGGGVAGNPADQHAGNNGRQQQAQPSAEQPKQHSLDQQLANHLPASRAHGVAHRHLADPAGGPHQQQAGDIHARHQHQQPNHSHQHHQRYANLIAQGREAAGAVEHLQLGVVEEGLLPSRLVLEVLKLFRAEGVPKRSQSRLRLLTADARLQPSGDRQPLRPAVFQILPARRN